MNDWSIRSLLALTLVSGWMVSDSLIATDQLQLQPTLVAAEEAALPVTREPISQTKLLLDTACRLQIYHEGQEDVLEAGFDYIDSMEQLMSSHVSDSDIDRINQAAGKEAVKVAPETYTVIKRGLELAEETDGLYDITIGAVTDLWRIDSEDARKPDQAEIDAVLPLINYQAVTLDDEAQTVYLEQEGMRLELGSIAKGYIADGVAQVFRDHNISSAVIDLGGNIVVVGTSPNSDEGWKVGVQDPDEERGGIVGVKPVKDRSVVTSGVYERYVEVDGVKYHHILNPNTGYPADTDLSSVTIYSEESMDGDALSTAVFVLGRKDGMALIEELEDVEAVFVDFDHQVYLTTGLEDSFELLNDSYHLVKEID